jgi:hypothetical protein
MEIKMLIQFHKIFLSEKEDIPRLLHPGMRTTLVYVVWCINKTMRASINVEARVLLPFSKI